MPDLPPNPSLAQIVETAVAGAQSSIETMLPGRIVSYDHTSQKASVQPLIQGSFTNSEGTLTYVDFPIIHNCPVAFPSGDGGSITFPLANDDRCVLLFASRDMAGWLTDDGDRNQPNDPRMHALDDVVVLPGVRSFANALSSGAIDTSDMVLASTNDIRLGGSAASNYLAVATLVAAEVNQWISTVHDTHTHAGVTAGVSTSGVPLVVGTSVNGSNMESSKVKAL